MIYRKAALERLASPEQLDQQIQITSPAGWLALAGLLVTLLAGVGWSVLGVIPRKATGSGILIRSGGAFNVVTTGGGQVRRIGAAVGDRVESGQVVATLSDQVLDEKARQLEAALAGARARLAEHRAAFARQEDLREKERESRRRSLAERIGVVEEEGRTLAETLEAQDGLLRDGLITKQALLATRQRWNASRNELANVRQELGGLALGRLERTAQGSGELEHEEEAIEATEAQLREIATRITEVAEVRSPHTGRVLELAASEGALLPPGSPVLSLELLSDRLMAVVYVPADQGKLVQPGMAAEVVPTTVRREEHGYILGEVTSVAAFPSTSRGMRRLLSNEDLVAGLMALGPPIEVRVRLTPDPATPSGFRWSSSRGPDLAITSGTLVAGSIVVQSDPPYRLLIPKLKELVLGPARAPAQERR